MKLCFSQYQRICICIFTVFCISLISFADNKQVEPPVIRDITIKQLETLLSEKQQGLIIINLWATWCPPCVAELPYFGNIYKHYSEKEVHLYLVNIEGKDSKEKVLKPFLERRPLPCPVYLLVEGNPDDLAQVLKTPLTGALPVTLIYKGGKLIKKFEEEIKESDITNVLKENGVYPISQQKGGKTE